ncbi:MAG: hypothetical protein J7L54_05405 [Elusimicrobia bacterium]|nr:hypothetical protein [Elusimicrobiota bacterium]
MLFARTPCRELYVRDVTSLPPDVKIFCGSNFRGSDNYLINLFSGGKKVNSAKLKAYGKSLVMRSPGAARSGRVEIENVDALPEDNVFYFSFPLRTETEVLCYDGRPSLVSENSGAYFLLKIFDQFRGYRLKVVSEKDEFFSLLSEHKIVCISGMDDITDSRADRLRRWLSSGGILFFFPSTRTKISFLNEKLSDITPAYVYGMKNVEIRNVRLDRADWMDKSLESRNFAGLRVRKIFSVLPLEGAKTYLASRDYVLCLQKNYGRGVVFLFSVSADMEFSNLALQPGFPVLLLNAMNYFLWERKEMKLNYFVGDKLDFPQDSRIFSLSGGKMSASPLPPGLFIAKYQGGEKRFAVNLRRGTENALDTLDKQEIRKIFSGCLVFSPKNPDEVKLILSGRPLKNFFFIAFFVFILAELILSFSA